MPEKKSQVDKLHRKTIDTMSKKQARKKRPRRKPAEAVAVAVGAAPDQTDLNNRVKTGSSKSRQPTRVSNLPGARSPAMKTKNPSRQKQIGTSRNQDRKSVV